MIPLMTRRVTVRVLCGLGNMDHGVVAQETHSHLCSQLFKYLMETRIQKHPEVRALTSPFIDKPKQQILY